jgi:hypothetical protein
VIIYIDKDKITMDMTTFVRKPFKVEAIEITEENIEEIAEFVGTLRTKEDGTLYIQVAPRLVPNVFKVFPGFWMTKMGDNIRCYSKKIFNEQFVKNAPDIDEWVQFMNQKAAEPTVGQFGRIVDIDPDAQPEDPATQLIQ